ncbi:hypothetical protein QYF36_018978 [Acer negundo]|nr:hypothetical protein QYF36_018978 [Acer negundo]
MKMSRMRPAMRLPYQLPAPIVTAKQTEKAEVQNEEVEVSGRDTIEVIKCKTVVEEACTPGRLGESETIIDFQESSTNKDISGGPQPVQNKEATPQLGPRHFNSEVSLNLGNFGLPMPVTAKDLYGPTLDSKLLKLDGQDNPFGSVANSDRVGKKIKAWTAIPYQFGDLGVLKKKTDFRCGKRKADLVITEDDFSNKKGKTMVQSVDTIVEYVTYADVTSYSVSQADTRESKEVISNGRSLSARQTQ